MCCCFAVFEILGRYATFFCIYVLVLLFCALMLEKWCPECNASEIAAAEFRKVRDIYCCTLYTWACALGLNCNGSDAQHFVVDHTSPESEKPRQRVSNADRKVFANPESFCNKLIIC